MTGIPVDVAVEDELSEFIVLRLLAVAKPTYHVGVTYRRDGFGYLRRTINGWNAAARGKPFVVLTDLDDALCPADLIGEWLTSAPSPNLLFRVAVREVEAWLHYGPMRGPQTSGASFRDSLGRGGVKGTPCSLADIALIMSSETPAFIMASVSLGVILKLTWGAVAIMRKISFVCTPAETNSIGCGYFRTTDNQRRISHLG